MDSNPLEMALAKGLLTPERAAALAAAVDPVLPAGPALPSRVFWGDLKAPVYGDDPTELIRHRFLYKGGMGLICGPTGIGKSAFVAQMMTHFAAGRELFGIEPGEHYARNGMRIMLVQAENDEGDLAEMRDGVERGCAELTPEENEQKKTPCSFRRDFTWQAKEKSSESGICISTAMAVMASNELLRREWPSASGKRATWKETFLPASFGRFCRAALSMASLPSVAVTSHPRDARKRASLPEPQPISRTDDRDGIHLRSRAWRDSVSAWSYRDVSPSACSSYHEMVRSFINYASCRA